jgi:predicted lipoprotein with Yx(FWY)xxD motif
MRRSSITVAGVALVGLALAGCGESGSGSSGGSGGQKASPAAAVMDSSSIKTSHSAFGDILVDGSGRTLYLFTQDGTNTNSMSCDAACVKLWPHMKGSPHAGAGVHANLIGKTKGSGPEQVTYAGHPLYYYAKDRKPGDLKGQGIDKIWYVLNAQGAEVKKAAPATNGTGSGTGSGGYGY